MKKLSLLTIKPIIAINGNYLKSLRAFLLAFLFTCLGAAGYAQVVVVPGSGGTVVCPTSLSCTTLGTITIGEVTSPADFALGADQLVLTIPTGWQFCTAATPTATPTGSAGDFATGVSVTITPTTLTLNFTVSGVYRFDSITISGVQVQPLSPAAAPGNIAIASPAGVTGINGITTATNFGSLRLAATTANTYTVTGGGAYCPPGGVGVHIGLTGSDLGLNYQLYAGSMLVTTLAGTGLPLDFGAQMPAPPIILPATYTVRATNGAVCGLTVTMAGSATITSAGSVGGITGVHSLCAYTDSETVSDVTTGGIWNSSLVTVDNSGFASNSAEVQAFAAGVGTITYTTPTGCRAIAQVTVNPNAPAITGPDSLCVNGTDTLTDALAGGTWTSSNTAVATVDSVTGVVHGVLAGTTLISYSIPTGCDPAPKTITVNPLPSPITATDSLIVCVTHTISAFATTGFGTWTVANTSIATLVVTGTGSAVSNVLITGASPGVTPITYSLPTGCATITSVTVDPLPDPIGVDLSTVCIGGNITITETSPGGTWSSSNTAVATVVPGTTPGTAIVTGAGNATTPVNVTITYTLPAGGCSTSAVITVEPLPSAIFGTDSLCVNAAGTVHDTTAGGTWTSSDPTVASVYNPSGSVVGNNPGTTVITYTLSTGCSTSMTLTVNSNPSPITAVNSFACAGDSLIFEELTGGGTWSVVDPSIATIVYQSVPPITAVDSAVVVGAPGGGSTIIVYTLPTGCNASASFTIDPVPSTPVPSAPQVCQGQTVQFTDAISGGTWSSSDQTIGTIDSLTGVLTGGSNTGTISITYTGIGGCSASYNTFQVNGRPPILGTTHVICQGTSNATVLLDSLDASHTGTWTSTNTAVATVLANSPGSLTATVTGAGGGVDTIVYTSQFGCVADYVITVNPITDIIGNSQICVLDSFPFFDGTPGGVWSSSNTFVATVNTSGFVFGASAGTATISYNIPTTGCTATFDVTVNPIPLPITGIDSVCVGSTTTLADASGGGVWGVTDISVATITSGFGLSPATVLGERADTTTITYTFAATGCYVKVVVTVNPFTPIFGNDSVVCVLDSIQLSDTTAVGTGGVWSSSDSTIATVGSTGVVTGVSAGTVTINYLLLTGGCSSSFRVTVNPLPSPITGADSLCVGSFTQLADSSGGGAGNWTSGNTSIATVNPGTGKVGGVSAGVDVITYTLPVTGCLITTQVTVDPLPTNIYFTTNGYVCAGDTISLRDTTTGGAWTSSDTAVATVDTNGLIHGVTAGTSIIQYTLRVGACPAQVIVTVYPIPNIRITSVPNPPVICKGGAAALNASGADTSGGTGSYAWTPAYGLSSTAVANPMATPTITTAYEVIGTTQFGCRDSAFITVVVDSMLNHLKIVGVDSVCAGICDTLKASGNPEAMFSWHPATGLSSTIGDTVVACTATTQTYVAVAIDAMGCTDSASFTVTVNQIPQLFIEGPTPVIVCRGGVGTQVIVNASNVDSNTMTYAWSPNLFISCDSCPNPVFNDTFNLIYRVIGTSKYGCYDSLTVKVSVLDTNVNTFSHDTDICIGDSIKLFVNSHSVTSNLDVPTYYWTPDYDISNQNIFDPEVNPTVTTTYSVTIRENVCFTVVDTVRVTVQPLPAITISPSSPIVTVAGTPTRLVVSAPNVDAVRFLWTPSTGLNCDTCFDPTAIPTSNIKYTVTVTSFYGCVSTDTVSIQLNCDNSEVFVPNTFTPNGDGVNDRFYVSGKGISLITNFKVFNRWGELMFEAHNIPANNSGYGWDGTYKGYVLEPDVFIYVVDALCELGTPYHYQGDVSIVR